MAIYDVIAGDGRPLVFPVPWARRPELSFLLTSEQMKAALAAAGFAELSWADKTAEGIAWFNELQAKYQAGAPPLGLHVVMGKEFAGMAANLARNFREGRARPGANDCQAPVMRGSPRRQASVLFSNDTFIGASVLPPTWMFLDCSRCGRYETLRLRTQSLTPTPVSKPSTSTFSNVAPVVAATYTPRESGRTRAAQHRIANDRPVQARMHRIANAS